MWRVASEVYTYLAGHPLLTDTVLHNGKTDNDRQIINKQDAAAEINQHTNQHNKQKTAQIIVVCVPIISKSTEDGTIVSTILNTVPTAVFNYLISYHF